MSVSSSSLLLLVHCRLRRTGGILPGLWKVEVLRVQYDRRALRAPSHVWCNITGVPSSEWGLLVYYELLPSSLTSSLKWYSHSDTLAAKRHLAKLRVVPFELSIPTSIPNANLNSRSGQKYHTHTHIYVYTYIHIININYMSTNIYSIYISILTD